METTQIAGATAGDLAQKLSLLKEFSRADPANQRLARECIELALQAGDYAFALDRLDAVLAGSPEDLRARFDRATALIGQREYAAAIEALRGILSNSPSLVAAQINLGLCHYCRAEYADARLPLDAAYAAGERSADLLRLLVSSYHHLGLMNEAVSLADQNAKSSSTDPVLAGVYALVYLDASQPSKAARWMGKALAGNPNSVDGLTVQATLNAARMLTAHAKEQFERVLQLAADNGRAWIGLGTLALLRRDLPQAKTLLARGLELMPLHVGSWHVLAWTHLISGDLDASEALFQRALQIDRNFAESHGGLASVAALRGDTGAAERGVKVALGLDPACLSAHFARAVLISRAGDAAAAARLIKEKLTGLSPGDGSLLSRTIEAAASKL
jgi:Tfp pilus assembly protein PilF